MYIKIVNDQKILIDSAIQKAGSYRALEKELNIPKSSLVNYKQQGALPEERFLKIIEFLNIKKNSLEIENLEKNWKQKLGGKKCVEIKKKKGTFKSQLKNAQKLGVKGIKQWHKKMKKENPKKYHEMQYEKFKKIGGYKYKTLEGIKVRNKFEKEVADTLSKLKLDYQYEPLIKAGGKWFFPDFLINEKIIVECTEWNGVTKSYQLLEKISHLEKEYDVFVVIPKHLYRKYKILDKHLLLGVDELVRVAQW